MVELATGSDGPIGATAEAAARGDQDISLGDIGGAVLLASDMRVALLLLDEARYRAVHRLFGVSREESWPVTLVALALLAGVTHDKFEQVLCGAGRPTGADAVLGAAALREALLGIPGPSSRDTPLIGTLMMVAMLGAMAGPGLCRALHGIRASSHHLRLSFSHRYGHVIRSRRLRPTAPAHG
jgi:hypothetical protein